MKKLFNKFSDLQNVCFRNCTSIKTSSDYLMKSKLLHFDEEKRSIYTLEPWHMLELK